MRLVLAIAALLAWWPRPALAGPNGTLTHRVKQGDTIQLLAAEYYGDRRHAIFIMVANKLQHDRPLRPGERLGIPMNREITVAPGDTLSSLAESHLGDARRRDFLASFNKLEPDDSLAAGQTLQIPLTVQHTAASQESITDIAAAYFASRKQARLIREYNFLDKKNTLEPGEKVIIPITHVQIQQSRLPPPDKESQARVAKRARMQTLAIQSLESARASWKIGDYAAVKRDLTRIDMDYLDTDLAVEVGVLLGSTYVAFDDTDSALAKFRQVLERNPDHTLGTYQVSPKIREVWVQAGGAVERTDRP